MRHQDDLPVGIDITSIILRATIGQPMAWNTFLSWLLKPHGTRVASLHDLAIFDGKILPGI